MYEFGKGGINGREHIVDALARFTARLHEAGVYHKDYSPGNILFDETPDSGEVKFCIVDINRMRFAPVSVRKGCANFARLWGQKDMFCLLASAYAKARNADGEDCIRWILHYRDKFWRGFVAKRLLPFCSDEAMADSANIRVSVILSTYNQPDWLEKVLWGYEMQTDRRFEVIIADDGSEDATRSLIEAMRSKVSFPVIHVWHPDEGFRKCTILNKAILEASADYLLFSDGDCIPRMDFVATHLKYRCKGRFLSGGYFKLPTSLSKVISKEDIFSGRCFNLGWLQSRGLISSFKNNKLTSFGLKAKLLNGLTPARASWNGHNASGWRKDIMAANGFNEEMQYGGEDRELGERLVNAGIRGLQIRYSAICLHLDHSRGYVSQQAIARNNQIRAYTRQKRLTKTQNGNY
jgi:glycosyltransferase involved in cell wall biosynthesis